MINEFVILVAINCIANKYSFLNYLCASPPLSSTAALENSKEYNRVLLYVENNR